MSPVALSLTCAWQSFNCNGTIVNDDQGGDVMQLQGDQRKNIFEFLTNEKICEAPEVRAATLDLGFH